MLKAKLDSIRKNKKGFSLVELIIVIAIMVALIAVMAPSFVKYVKKSRDAAMDTAVEDFVSALKTEFADPESEWKRPSSTVTISFAQNSAKKIAIEITGTLKDTAGAAVTAADMATKTGLDTAKVMGQSDSTYTVTISSDGNVTYA